MELGGVSEGGASSGGLASWQTKLSNWMDDEEEQDSDTDSKLSGSAMVDSVMWVKNKNYDAVAENNLYLVVVKADYRISKFPASIGTYTYLNVYTWV